MKLRFYFKDSETIPCAHLVSEAIFREHLKNGDPD